MTKILLKVRANLNQGMLPENSGRIKKAVFEKISNSTGGDEYVGGHLFIREDGLFFHPHKFNFQIEDLFIPKETILTVEKKYTLGIIPNGLLINSEKRDYFFVVSKRQKVLEFIKTNYKL
ncbi:hypothetical protein [Carnobacterium maltaromaticum]|uniref:hypothetical protein n=1 Tax=Carnobacterium maltaromaticum TaxID=2751 RepID=UPI00295F46AC|nr:hypothetical protein [Carnobacterium maltaromaticum]